MTIAREQDTQMTVLLLALEQIATGSKPVTKAQDSLADIEMAAIARNAIAEYRQTQAETPKTVLTDIRPHQPTQTVAVTTAHRRLGELLAAKDVIQ